MAVSGLGSRDIGKVINVFHRQYKQGGSFVGFFLLISIIIIILVATCDNRITEEAGNGVDVCNSVCCCNSWGHVPNGFCAFGSIIVQWLQEEVTLQITLLSIHLRLICCHLKEHVVGEVPQLACLRMVGVQLSPVQVGKTG